MIIPAYKNFNQERKIGEHTIILPDPPNLKKIAYKEFSKEKQFFRREYLPDNWTSLSREDKNRFANEQWDIRGREGEKGTGFWFWNNGNIEWMSPNHYFYCNWWKIGKVKIPQEYILDKRDIYFPFFTDADRDWFYLADDCYHDPNCGGLFTIEFRRGGKTYRAGCYQYEKVSKTHDAKGGTQSRDDTDSYNVFEKIVFGWRNLPPFFKPVDTGNSNPVSDLVFDEPKKINTKATAKTYSDILHSWIDYGNASEGFYDGKEQIINIQDEIGKIAKKRAIDLQERIRVVVECCYIMGEKVGMVIATTTVEEMEKSGGDQAKLLWIRSSTLDSEAKQYPHIFNGGHALNELGFTQSKLKRYFRPSYKGYLGKDTSGVPFVDRYGYSDEERTKQHFLKKRKTLKGADLASEKRKFPIVIDDCWVSDGKKLYFNTEKIEDQLKWNDENIAIGRHVTKGNFIWKIKDQEAEFVPSENGKWLVSWLPKPELRNKKIMKFGKPSPGNTDTGCFGLDPYDDGTTYDDRKSDAAAYGGLRFDPLNPYQTGIAICEYVNRPPAPEIMWEDMLIMCHFYGWELLVEKNKGGTYTHFRQRGYENYMMKRPDETKSNWNIAHTPENEEGGIHMSGELARNALLYAIESHIDTKIGLIHDSPESKPYMGRCDFNGLLLQLRDYEHGEKWTKYDRMVGFGLMLLGLRYVRPKPVTKKSMQLFDTFRVVGNQSVKVKNQNRNNNNYNNNSNNINQLPSWER